MRRCFPIRTSSRRRGEMRVSQPVDAIPETVPPHILVVDDDPQIRDLLQEYFTANELRASAISSGKEMMGILADQAIDLVVLDLRLAGEDGMALARRVREGSAIPIIMLTGVLDEADRVMALELGADDCLTKPFSPRELLARIRTVLRRIKREAPRTAGRREARAYRSIDVQVLRLRRKIETNPEQPRFVVTERGVGYSFGVPVDILY
jgi:two-component system OmpR family response regulator